MYCFLLIVSVVLPFAMPIEVKYFQDIQGKIVCKGFTACSKVVDGDTVGINGMRIRLSLVDLPNSVRPTILKQRIQLCPIGSGALVDQDDGQKGGSYGRMIGVVYCNYNPSNLNITKNLNEEMLKSGFFECPYSASGSTPK
jgi:endonuclease YncB( thermonuclease family)